MRDIMLILHFLGLAMGVGTSIAMMVLGRASGKMELDERVKFGLNISVLRLVGQTGLAVLIITGLYLMTPYWKVLGAMPVMITKLVLVGILTILVVMIGINAARAKKSDTPGIYFRKNSQIGPLALLTALAIIVLAVLQYH